MTRGCRHLEREVLQQCLLLAGGLWLIIAIVLWFTPWYWANKVLLLFVLLILILPWVFMLRKQLLAVFDGSNHVLASIISGSADVRLGPAAGVLAEHYQLLNLFAEQYRAQRLISTEQQLLLQKVSQHIAVAIIAIDDQQRITLMNPAAELLLQTKFEKWRSWPLAQLGIELATFAGDAKLVKLQIGAQQKQLYIASEPYFEQGKRHQLLFMTDVQQLLFDEERQAWQKLFRVLSHEVNNSLTPICAISQGLSKQLTLLEASGLEHLVEGLAVIQERAQALNTFMKSYQQLSRLPTPNKQLLDIKQLVCTVCRLFNEPIHLSGPELQLYADPSQLQQILINVIKNALEAVAAVQGPPIMIEWTVQGALLLLTVTDEGSGIQNPDNLFVPFYSTKADGTGIGLVLSRQIARNHGGDLQLLNRSPAPGAQSRLFLPL